MTVHQKSWEMDVMRASGDKIEQGLEVVSLSSLLGADVCYGVHKFIPWSPNLPSPARNFVDTFLLLYRLVSLQEQRHAAFCLHHAQGR
jgi:hypothetical protein